MEDKPGLANFRFVPTITEVRRLGLYSLTKETQTLVGTDTILWFFGCAFCEQNGESVCLTLPSFVVQIYSRLVFFDKFDYQLSM